MNPTPPNWLERAKQAEQALHALGFRAVVASEIEFYIAGGIPDASFWEGMSPYVLQWEKERGEGQYEVALRQFASVHDLIQSTNQIKEIIINSASKRGLIADFAARPFQNQPGSGLHIHLHLEDASGMNLFWKNDSDMSPPLVYALGGLLATMQANMQVFAPTPASQARFKSGSHAPTTISWGANNRTTALRLPDSGTKTRRIEHRVAGADADIAAVVAVILEGIIYGMTHESDPGPQMFGDAALQMYGLPRLLNT